MALFSFIFLNKISTCALAFGASFLLTPCSMGQMKSDPKVPPHDQEQPKRNRPQRGKAPQLNPEFRKKINALMCEAHKNEEVAQALQIAKKSRETYHAALVKFVSEKCPEMAEAFAKFSPAAIKLPNPKGHPFPPPPNAHPEPGNRPPHPPDEEGTPRRHQRFGDKLMKNLPKEIHEKAFATLQAAAQDEELQTLQKDSQQKFRHYLKLMKAELTRLNPEEAQKIEQFMKQQRKKRLGPKGAPPPPNLAPAPPEE